MLPFLLAKRRRGFLLAEAMVASAILAVVLGSAFNSLVQARSGSAGALHAMKAARFAQDKMEELRNTDYASLPASASDTPAINYNRTVTVTTINTDTIIWLTFPLAYKSVTVGCTYLDNGVTKTVSFSTLRSAS